VGKFTFITYDNVKDFAKVQEKFENFECNDMLYRI